MTAKSAKSFSWTHYFPPKPTYTDKNIPASLQGKVYIVTGANSGLGRELAQILYAKGAKVYVTCRSSEKGTETVDFIKKAEPKSKGELVFLSLDLADLDKVQSTAKSFLQKESKLHVLFNNAGVMTGVTEPPPKTAQGHELALGVNCVGTFLFTELLTPILAKTAKSEPTDTVRVVWLSSFGLLSFAPEERGIDMDNLDYHVPRIGIERYGVSKCGVWLLGVEYARRHKDEGIVSVPINPGNLRTLLARDQGLALKFIAGRIVYPPINGAYTQLFAAFSPDITSRMDLSEEWVIPFGRIGPHRADLSKATKPKEEGGNGNAQEFWDWNKQQVKNYL